MSQITDDLTASIQTAIKGDSVYADMSNTTKLYEKIFRNNGALGQSNLFGNQYGPSANKGDDILALFSDPEIMSSLMQTYSDTRYIKVIDEEIDMCLKHMPKLQMALNIKKDNVLCADNFSKSFIIPELENSLNNIDAAKFDENSKYIMREYNFEYNAELWYDDAATYGEEMVYCVPYKKALSELLERKKNTRYAARESTIMESGKLTSGFKPTVRSEIIPTELGTGSFVLKLNRTGILEDAVLNVQEAVNNLRTGICESVYEQFLSEASTQSVREAAKDVKFDKTIGDNLTYDDDERTTANDGLVTATSDKNTKIKTPGCVLKTLPHDQVIPLDIEGINMGYYYIELKQNAALSDASYSRGMYNSDHITSITNMLGSNPYDAREEEGDNMLRYISGKIAENIDAAFINANQNLRKEIYTMLKYNDKFNRLADTVEMNVTYIPPEDIIHIKFNEDPKTHRGRSDIWDGLIAAKMWIMMNSTTVIGNATRGQDKRVYYVKTMVETNVAKTLLNVVEQIKKGNFGIRQMESVNNILNVVGKFNDFVIPVGPSGDSPVSFDILSGQQFEFPTDAMDRLEESAIGPTGVPLEVVNSAMNMDFAIRYTMTNGRMLKDVMKRQNYICKPYSQIFTRLYNCEFNDNATIKIRIPEPIYLSVTQGSQLVQNVTQYIDSLADIECATKDDTYRAKFRQKMLRDKLGQYIDTARIDEIKREIEMEMNIEATEKTVKGGEESGGY
ncbi:hypothetical protein [Bacteroides acidifaciens]|uniref:hypothetical protein n=1 Tax=Bacteroides acidifaciens TaxID=85831 RepID=UPI00263B150C|nr:hypothetical protein [Bacteroides acidifaciens]